MFPSMPPLILASHAHKISQEHTNIQTEHTSKAHKDMTHKSAAYENTQKRRLEDSSLDTTTEEQLNRSLEKQIQRVRQIQTMLGVEKMRLKTMLTCYQVVNTGERVSYVADKKSKGENKRLERKHIRICSINRKMEKQTSDENTNILENQKKPSIDTDCDIKSTVENKERFDNFWSGCNDIMEDDEDMEKKEKTSCVILEDVVVQEVNKNRNKEWNV